MPLLEKDWINIYEGKGALWMHDGNPKRPHALLSAGDHSDGFFNSGIIAEDSHLIGRATAELRHKLYLDDVDLANIHRVVGPAMGAITLAHSLAESITSYKVSQFVGANPCLFAYTVKREEDGKKWMEFDRIKVKPGEEVLLIEDVLTSGASVKLTADAVIRAGGKVKPYVVTLVNRSPEREIFGAKVYSLIHRRMKNWKVKEGEECTLCKAGSEAIRPKEADNWKRLNAQY